jgi:hypothetical protein
MQYPMIAQPQYAFAPTMTNFKEGGLASLAQEVQAAGRNGDTMLAHITPEEAGILQLLGGSGTINPETGLPEFFVKKLFKNVVVNPIKKVYKALESGVEGVAKALGPVGQIAAAYFGGPIGAAVYAGMAPEGSKFDFKRAALAGGLTYGAQQLKNMDFGGSSAGGNAAGTGGPYDISDVGSMGDLGMADIGTTPYGAPIQTLAPPPTVDYAFEPGAGPSTVTQSINPAATGLPSPPPPPTMLENATKYVSDIPTKISEGIQSLPETISELPSKALDYAKELPGNVANYVLDPKNIPTNILIGTQVAAGVQAKKELDAQKAEAERVMAEQEKYTQEEIAFAQDVLKRYPIEYRRLTAEDIRSQNLAGGGLAGLNAFKAGGQPRFLKGGGDGMSDDIPATIGGRQKAALSDGEFVVPADVVSHLGNGSSRAGAKKLYSMMDNIRKARTGRERQAPEVNADRYMPA